LELIIALYSVFNNNVYIGIFTFLINYKELSACFENLPKKYWVLCIMTLSD